MSVLLNDTCDNFTNWTTTGAPTIASALHGNGFSFPIGSSNRAKYLIASGDRTASVTIGFNVRFGATIQHDFVVLYSDAGANNQSTIRLNANGSLSLFSPPSTVHGTTAAGTIAINTWYYIEATFIFSNAVGLAALAINGVEQFRATNQDTLGVNTTPVYDQVWLQSIGGAGSAAWLVDDVYIRNDNTYGVAPTVAATIATTFAFSASASAVVVGLVSATIATTFKFVATAVVINLGSLYQEPLGPDDGVPLGIAGYPGFRFAVQIAVVNIGNLLGTFILGTGILGGPRWYDITGFIQGLHWTRGGEPAQRPIAGALDFRLLDEDARWSPVQSSFYGPGTMCRVVVGDAVTLFPQFSGTVQAWNEAGAGLGAYDWVDVVCWENMFLLSEVNDHALAGVIGGGDTFTQRIDRLLDQADWQFGRDIETATAATFQASDFPSDVATEMYRTLDSVEVTMWPAKNGALMIRDRAVGSGASWLFDHPDQNTDSIVTENDDERILSSVDLARVGGTSVTYTNTGMAGRYQRRSTQRTDLITVAEPGDADLARVADGMLARGRQTYRLSSFEVQSGQGANQAQLIIESDLTDRVTVPYGPKVQFKDYAICGCEHDVQVSAAGVYWRATFALDIEADSGWFQPARWDEAHWDGPEGWE